MVGTGIFLSIGGLIAFGVTRSPYFSVEKIEVTGDLKQLVPHQIIGASRVIAGENLFGVSLKTVEENVLKLPWVKSVFVRRQIPSTLWISVKEERAKALLLDGDKLYFVSDEGKAFKEVQEEIHHDLPIVTGHSHEEPMRSAIELIDFFMDFGDFEVFGISEIHYSAITGFSIVTMQGPMEIKLGWGDFAAKLNRLKTIWLKVGERFGRPRGIDLDYEERVFVKL